MESVGSDCQTNVGFIPFSCLLASNGTWSHVFFLSWLLHGPEVIEKFDYVFAENGTVQYKHGRLLSKQVRAPQG